MPRIARLVLAHYPHHIIHRGHNKEDVFTNEKDYLYYLKNLKESKEKLNCQIFSYCLMSNHIHLIINPGEKPENLAKLMQRVAALHTQYMNKKHHRTGTLWESRYKSSPIQDDRYLMMCSRYIELNPVRAGLVYVPERYAWSSYRYKIKEKHPWLDIDPFYESLGKNRSERAKHYQQWVNAAIQEDLKTEWSMIRNAVQSQCLTGKDVAFRKPGRPKKQQRNL